MRRARERGTVTVVVAATSLLLGLGAAVCADLGVLLVTRARAQTAADAAALAAAAVLAPVLADGADPLLRATDAARSNGARLTRCLCATGDEDALVEVEITVRTLIVGRWDGLAVSASARAALDPDVYSYRG